MMNLTSFRDFDAVARSLNNQKVDFAVVEKGKKKSVFINGKIEIHYRSVNKKISGYFNDPKNLNVIKIVHAQANSYIKANKLLIKEVKQKNGAVKLKKGLFRSFPDGSYFYLMDIKHAYWRFAYLLGYIKYDTYKKYKDSPDFKLARNIALSTLATKKKKKYYSQGKLINEITCLNSCSWMMYKNIRYSTYNTCGDIERLLGDKCVAYRVDGVMVTGDAIQIVKNFMKSRKLSYEIVECQKINDLQYTIIDTGEVKNL
jgi:hypothetical protein